MERLQSYKRVKTLLRKYRQNFKSTKIFYEKNRDRILLQKQNKRSIQYGDLVISYVELENRLKATEEKLKNLSISDSQKR